MLLETERLILRPPNADDLPWILEQINTPAMMQCLGGVRTAEQVADGLAADVEAFADGTWLRWTVWQREPSCRVARCGLFTIRSSAAPEVLRGAREIGWMLAEPFWGTGYASEAARALLGFGFEVLGDKVIHAQTSDSNLASTRMMTRLGFTRCAELDYVDPDYPVEDNPTTVYRMTRGDWAQRA